MNTQRLSALVRLPKFARRRIKIGPLLLWNHADPPPPPRSIPMVELVVCPTFSENFPTLVEPSEDQAHFMAAKQQRVEINMRAAAAQEFVRAFADRLGENARFGKRRIYARDFLSDAQDTPGQNQGYLEEAILYLPHSLSTLAEVVDYLNANFEGCICLIRSYVSLAAQVSGVETECLNLDEKTGQTLYSLPVEPMHEEHREEFTKRLRFLSKKTLAAV